MRARLILNEVGIGLVGLDIDAKAALVEAAFWAALPYQPSDYAGVSTRLVRTDKADPATNEEATAVWRLSLKDPDERVDRVRHATFVGDDLLGAQGDLDRALARQCQGFVE